MTYETYCISQFQLRPPPSPGNCRTFAHLVSPDVARWSGICLTRGYPWAFDTHVVSDAKSKHGGFYRKGTAVPQIGSSVNVGDWTKLWKFSRFHALISSLLIKAQIELSRATINVNRRTYPSLIKIL